jgi:hypothetical protein
MRAENIWLEKFHGLSARIKKRKKSSHSGRESERSSGPKWENQMMAKMVVPVARRPKRMTPR